MSALASGVVIAFVASACAMRGDMATLRHAELEKRGSLDACRAGDAIWYEVPFVARLHNGRPFGAEDAPVAVEFVCGGVLRSNPGSATPDDAARWKTWSVVADVERRAIAILLTWRHPETAPTRYCTVFTGLLNQELERALAPFRFDIQSAWAVLDGGLGRAHGDLLRVDQYAARPDGRPWSPMGASPTLCEPPRSTGAPPPDVP